MYKILKRSQTREAVLRAELIKQKEVAQQAERKSMNKSMAFARASHDVRNSLQGITMVIDQCLSEVAPESELARNLEMTKSCADNLQMILDSVLETSKVESGKMQLEETEFNISKIIEESVDSSNIKAHQKGLEMIWDPCDFSVLKLGNVKGDALKFKQILDNLLGNAVKCTTNGRIVVRAWEKKWNLKILSTSDFRFSVSRTIRYFSRRLLRKRIDKQGISSMQSDSYGIELIFEVDDTGIGIPVEKRNSVFENYVQVKSEKVKDELPQGTGLGLGIVQSFVRLMGGEISIQDNEPGAKGTCFKFNIFLTSIQPTLGDTSSEFFETFTVKGVRSLLFIRECETKMVLQRLMESMGIKVHWTARKTDILPTIEKMKRNLNPSRKLYSILSVRNSSSLERESFLSLREKDIELGQNEISHGGKSLRILVIVDISSGDISEIWSALRDFTANNPCIFYKIICIYDFISDQNKEKFRTLGCDLLRKPVHGSRLRELFALIQELERMDTEDLKKAIYQPLDQFEKEKKPVKINGVAERRIEIEHEKPLNGMHILFVDDDEILGRVVPKTLANLGAEITRAKNGAVAVELVKKALEIGSIYDIIFTDCQMEPMDGYETTRRIREEESRYGIRIPIIALSGNAGAEAERKSILSGMDFHLTKPMNTAKMLEAVHVACSKQLKLEA